ncbi:Rossmann-fold NAD(P)-binding domain-containing protein, partial [Microbulbifer hainanensis]|uniref:hypothetical protein n=1 Tax=Microbulbifer hainanensis TaxID=2735675 RepID=UPI001D011EC7
RFIASANTGSPLIDLAKTLKDELGSRASKVPRYQIPNWLLTTLSVFNETLKEPASESGKVKNIDNTRAKKILGWEPRSVKETIRDSAESLYKFKLVKE